MRLYHFSSEADIEEFVPRAPLRHPESEAFVYAIDDRHMPLYLFSRDCPRIAIWDCDDPNFKMKLFIDHSWQVEHEQAHIYRYEFEAEGFEDCTDHGCWVSRTLVKPISRKRLTNLPGLIDKAGAVLEVTDLVTLGQSLFNPEKQEWTTPLHVSMIRLSNLSKWDGAPGKPVLPK